MGTLACAGGYRFLPGGEQFIFGSPLYRDRFRLTQPFYKPQKIAIPIKSITKHTKVSRQPMLKKSLNL